MIGTSELLSKDCVYKLSLKHTSNMISYAELEVGVEVDTSFNQGLNCSLFFYEKDD